eukprot:gnl/Spiro4/18424_TR9862_c1_g1_i1.p2 gnl/Spiro4/18424_TR9862_c1_g1~~gnl/Spiro4/18424_TR9862_c1_g1_i1.p2  ORF type:complete len:394 (+),score=108.26 gnl/Spiro4/18424_TR9862_c1_g1_i1:40-1182(+)
MADLAATATTLNSVQTEKSAPLSMAHDAQPGRPWTAAPKTTEKSSVQARPYSASHRLPEYYDPVEHLPGPGSYVFSSTFDRAAVKKSGPVRVKDTSRAAGYWAASASHEPRHAPGVGMYDTTTSTASSNWRKGGVKFGSGARFTRATDNHTGFTDVEVDHTGHKTFQVVRKSGPVRVLQRSRIDEATKFCDDKFGGGKCGPGPSTYSQHSVAVTRKAPAASFAMQSRDAPKDNYRLVYEQNRFAEGLIDPYSNPYNKHRQARAAESTIHKPHLDQRDNPQKSYPHGRNPYHGKDQNRAGFDLSPEQVSSFTAPHKPGVGLMNSRDPRLRFIEIENPDARNVPGAGEYTTGAAHDSSKRYGILHSGSRRFGRKATTLERVA